jgi:hypothetical protein
MGEATHEAAKSAMKRVILFGRYLCSRNTQGNIGMGTEGFNRKMFGSQQENAANRMSVVTRISDIKTEAYPRVKELEKQLTRLLMLFSAASTTNRKTNAGGMVAKAAILRFW